MGSDHASVTVIFALKPGDDSRPIIAFSTNFNFSKTDWNSFRSCLSGMGDLLSIPKVCEQGKE